MSSAGYMYTQIMDETSRAQHGPFYVTNVLEITHEDLKVSLKYSYATKICLQIWDIQNITLDLCSVFVLTHFDIFRLCLHT